MSNNFPYIPFFVLPGIIVAFLIFMGSEVVVSNSFNFYDISQLRNHFNFGIEGYYLHSYVLIIKEY